MTSKRSTKQHDELEKKVLANPISRAAYEKTKLQLNTTKNSSYKSGEK